MTKKIELSVIIPCYNEEGNVRACVERVPTNMPWETEIIVVDDGSKDNTAKIARSIKRKNLHVIRYAKNMGKGYAFRTGLNAARGEVVVICDADMATQPEEIPDIVRPIFEDKADCVNGTRMIFPMEKGAMRPLHYPGNMIFALMVSAIIRKRLSDTLCGFKAFRRKMLLGKLKENSWMDFELLIKARRNGLRIVEVPIHYKTRKVGESKMKTFKHAWKMFMMLLKSWKND